MDRARSRQLREKASTPCWVASVSRLSAWSVNSARFLVGQFARGLGDGVDVPGRYGSLLECLLETGHGGADGLTLGGGVGFLGRLSAVLGQRVTGVRSSAVGGQLPLPSGGAHLASVAPGSELGDSTQIGIELGRVERLPRRPFNNIWEMRRRPSRRISTAWVTDRRCGVGRPTLCDRVHIRRRPARHRECGRASLPGSCGRGGAPPSPSPAGMRGARSSSRR